MLNFEVVLIPHVFIINRTFNSFLLIPSNLVFLLLIPTIIIAGLYRGFSIKGSSIQLWDYY